MKCIICHKGYNLLLHKRSKKHSNNLLRSMSHPIIYKIMKKKENSYTASQIRSLKHSPYRAPEYYAENSQTTNEADH